MTLMVDLENEGQTHLCMTNFGLFGWLGIDQVRDR